MERENGVIVEAKLRGEKALKATVDDVAGSGFILETNKGYFVITSASWVSPLIESNVDSGYSLEEMSQWLREWAFFSLSFSRNGKLETRPATLRSIVSLTKVRRIFEKQFQKDSNAKWPASVGRGNEVFVGSMTAVLVLEVQDASFWHRTCSLRCVDEGRSIALGLCVCVLATPLSNACPDVFINSTIYGHVCCCHGDSNEVFLIDAPCPVGCEGGVVLSVTTGRKEKLRPLAVIGMVVGPVLLRGGALAGIGLVVTMEQVMVSLRESLGIIPLYTWNNIPHSFSHLQGGESGPGEWKRYICGVVAGDTWGTGIILDQNFVLTCSHVVKDDCDILVVEEKGRHHKADIAHMTKLDNAFDVAVLSTRELTHPVNTMEWEEECCHHGDRIAIVGYGSHNPLKHSTGPLLTFGYVSKVLYNKDIPVMYQTTAAANPGCSGGVVVATETGKPVGMVTSIVSDKSCDTHCPTLNFVIPLSLLRPFLREYVRTQDVSQLVAMEILGEDPAVKNIWRLSIESWNKQTVPTSKL